ncbi:hypothetical protein [Saccharothrix australiensis]|uniref:Uncharacterized protein n=1 Tax=Saccharothrix australiensis TaxID=2072 RepID=A0A495W873_9PSEU|nr:hypothetical protein [Saccharothrix australiensis]RKT57290.1 hypothetical protein C8E97_6008 [Saccharothrix australiensis]
MPFVFGSAVLGLTGLAGLLVGVPDDLTLSSPLFGAAAAVGVGTSGVVSWRRPWQRVWLRWGYTAAWLVTGIAVDGLRLPVAAVVAIGVPSLIALLSHWVAERRRMPESTDQGMNPLGNNYC